MRYKFNQYSFLFKGQVCRVFAISILITLTACSSGGSGDSGGDVNNIIPLPLDYELDLYCPDVGIHREDCILKDPNNPYARVVINDNNKFELADDSPSSKSDFYLWGTAQAISPRGENQYYTALAMHEMYTVGSSPIAQEQTKKAYRSMLDNYFNSVTFFKITTPEGEVSLPTLLRTLVTRNLVKPDEANLRDLYDAQIFALEDLGKWGYHYDTDSGEITRIE